MKGEANMFRYAILVVLIVGLTACDPRPAPSGDDGTPPRITLTALESAGTQLFSTDEGPTAPVDACAEVRSFPTTITVTAVDDGGGIARVNISVFPGNIQEASAAPASAEVTTGRNRSTSFMTIEPRPPAGTVQPNVVATLDVTEFSGIVASASDTTGNYNELYQVDVRPVGDPVICRGE